MKRGEVWWADLPPPAGRRPVLLLSRDTAYSVRNQATVAPVTTRARGIPTEVPVGPEDGMPRVEAVNLDGLITVPLAVLDTRITALSAEKMAAVERAVKFALSLK